MAGSAYQILLHKLHIVKDVVVVFSEAFSIHPWMASYREENPDRNKYPLRMCRCPGNACPPQDFDINIVVNFLFEWHLGYIC
jgi:hypothetical protein